MRDVTYEEEDLRPRRGRAAVDDFDDEPERPSLWRRLIGRNLGDVIATALIGFVAIGIAVNALVRQSGPHPAPLFATAVIQPAAAAAVPVPAARPADVQTTATVSPRGEPTLASATTTPVRARSEVVADIQRELIRRRLYDGAADGLTGPKTEAAIRRYETQAGLRATGEASESLLGHMRRPAQRAQAATPAAAPARPAEPQTISQLLERDQRPQAPARTAAAAPARPAGPQSIGDLLTADTRPANPRQR